MKDDPLFRELPDSFDDRCPAPPTPPPNVRSWDVALTAFVSLAITAGVLMGIVPKFEEVFLQVKVPMPGMTLLLMTWSGIACDWPLLVAFLMTVVPASLQCMKPRWVSIARPLIPILSLMVWAWMAVALFLPLTCTLEGIGSRR